MKTPIEKLIDLLKQEEGFHAGGSIAQLSNLSERYYEETFTNE